jgi:iron complex outermembrane receptor protein
MSLIFARRSGAAAAVSAAALIVGGPAVLAQQAKQGDLPPVEVEQPDQAAKAKPQAAKKKPTPKPPAAEQSPEPVPLEAADAAGPTAAPPSPGSGTNAQNPYAIVPAGTRSGSLTVPTAAEARASIDLTPGGVEVVPAEEYKDTTPAVTLRDALLYVPGVFVQPKWGEDSRLSIRGSGLSRNFHGRGVYLLMDGVIPFTTADGSSDFQEIDPTAFSYIEVYKGANALQFGANSLGGAINFVTPTGYNSDLFGARVDVGSFGLIKTSVSSGAVSGNTDYFITGTWQQQDGFRDHSNGESFRGSGNIGFRLTENLETRFYVNANQIQQNIPGAVTREEALTDPTAAFVRPGLGPFGNGNDNVDRDFERNLDTIRVANRTTWRPQEGTLVDFGGFYMDRQLEHPISIFIDQDVENYGGFGRLVDDNIYGGFRNRFVAGVQVQNGVTFSQIFVNRLGNKGALISAADQKADNTALYAENSLFIVPDFALVGGVQYNYARRSQVGVGGSAQTGAADFDFWSPKAGFLWEPAKEWQVFGNISRSGEAPTFSEITITGITTTALEVQRATTYEIGTRGNYPDFRWDLSLYRSNIENEFQCRANIGPGGNVIADGTCTQINLDRTIHQGVEFGLAARLFAGIFEPSNRPDEVWLQGAYTYNDFRFDNDPRWGNNELPGAPPHVLNAELIYKHPSGVYAGPTVEWSPEAFFVDSANTLETTPYALLGAKLGFDDGGKWSAYVEGRNLTDETYIASASVAAQAGPNSALFEPGTGRAVYGGVQFRW